MKVARILRALLAPIVYGVCVFGGHLLFCLLPKHECSVAAPLLLAVVGIAVIVGSALFWIPLTMLALQSNALIAASRWNRAILLCLFGTVVGLFLPFAASHVSGIVSGNPFPSFYAISAVGGLAVGVWWIYAVNSIPKWN